MLCPSNDADIKINRLARARFQVFKGVALSRGSASLRQAISRLQTNRLLTGCKHVPLGEVREGRQFPLNDNAQPFAYRVIDDSCDSFSFGIGLPCMLILLFLVCS